MRAVKVVILHRDRPPRSTGNPIFKSVFNLFPPDKQTLFSFHGSQSGVFLIRDVINPGCVRSLSLPAPPGPRALLNHAVTGSPHGPSISGRLREAVMGRCTMSIVSTHIGARPALGAGAIRQTDRWLVAAHGPGRGRHRQPAP